MPVVILLILAYVFSFTSNRTYLVRSLTGDDFLDFFSSPIEDVQVTSCSCKLVKKRIELDKYERIAVAISKGAREVLKPYDEYSEECKYTLKNVGTKSIEESILRFKVPEGYQNLTSLRSLDHVNIAYRFKKPLSPGQSLIIDANLALDKVFATDIERKQVECLLKEVYYE